MNMIDVDNITKKFNIRYGLAGSLEDLFTPPEKKQTTALENISFTVSKGECVGLIGPNGSGKTTLLKVLSGVTKPTSGQYSMQGRIGPLIQIGAGFHPELTGLENIYLYGSILGMSRKEIDDKKDEIIEFAEISKFLNTPVKKYSSGMFIRLAFSVAIHIDPEILLIDEVLAVGDYYFRKKSLDKIESLLGDVTIIFVSHNLDQVSRICDRTILLLDGKIEKNASTNDVIKYYAELFSEGVEEKTSEKQFGESLHVENVKINKNRIQFERHFQIEFDVINDYNKFFYVDITFRGRSLKNYIVISSKNMDKVFNNRTGRIICNINELNLAPGLYAVNIELRDKKGKLIYVMKNATNIIVDKFKKTEFGNYYIDKFSFKQK
ncbi:MAG: ABC transporter ATP-binding protein [bacterium]